MLENYQDYSKNNYNVIVTGSSDQTLRVRSFLKFFIFLHVLIFLGKMRPLCLLKQNLRGNKNKFQLGINTISSLAPVLQKKFRSNFFMTLFRKTKRDTIIGKTIISYPPDTHRYVYVSGGKNSFFGKFGVLCFLKTPILRFALLPYYRQLILSLPNVTKKS